MKRFYLLLLVVLLFSLAVFAQKPKATPPVKKPAAVKTADEKEEFEKAVALTSAPERIAALQKFLNDFPKSEQKTRVLELIVSARAEIAEQKLTLSETEEGVRLFVLAAAEAPKPMSEQLFATVMLQLPTNLFYRGQPKAAFDVAKIIEEKVEGNAQRLLALGAFYLGVESADDAKRVAENVLKVDAATLPIESQISAYQMLGMANRLNFDLEAAANAYAKALELNPNSTVSKRSLAEMKRATGKTDEAAALYREILEKDAADNTAQTGLVLSLFDAAKQSDAEAELAKSLEANPKNLFLLVGAAYWYAAHGQADKAVNYAQKAVELEPRYTWGQIALARALMLQRKPLEAEKALLTARAYGNFPTLEYELASVRLAAGFYEEAAADLRKRFIVDEGVIYTRLGNRVLKESRNFTELLAPERRASIFQNAGADNNQETAEKLKSLLYLYQKLNDDKAPDEARILEAADEFVKGEDNAKTHRQIYVASRLLQKKIALPKVLELTQGAVRGVDSSLDVDSPSSAVLAEELFDARNIAAQRNQFVIVPALPRQTLSNILRGRIEEIAGWSLYQQEKPQESAVRLKRAIGILPEKSAWWRSSWWRLGAALEASGKPTEALDAYIRSYVSGEPDATKRGVIETLYQKINGTTEGLDQKIGAKPKPALSFLIKQPETTETVAKVETSPTPVPAIETSARPTPVVETTTKIEETTQAKVEPRPSSLRVVVTSTLPPPETTPTPKTEETPPPQPTPTPEITPTPPPTPSPTPTVEPSPEPSPTLTPTPSPTPEIKAETTPEIKPETSPEVGTTPKTTEPAPETVAKVATKPEKLIVEITDPLKKTTSETKTEPSPSPSPNDVKPEKTVVEVTDPLEKKKSETKPQANTEKPLFDPIVINVPKNETKPKTEPTEEKPSEKPKTEPETQPKLTEEKPKTEDPLASGEQRVRVIVTDNLSPENSTCSLAVGQSSISLVNNGGNLGVLVGYSDASGDTSKITATSSSPDDIDVSLEPEIGKQSKRAFFVVKSISPKTGIFTVTFNSPCGKKEVQVKVR
ncbi:MAG TPA: hypothetical protein VF721_12650 [Pyrinomonadaceae bacterium]|jgi:Flp pilus assembly protein TadD